MKRVALFFVAALVFAVVAPAFAQPFADVPTDIFAFDAVAELAAKGLIEGYPDGTFKGDRAMTRYEMAMVVARVLARIEAIKIPPPAAPPAAPPGGVVTRADLDALQRLLNEFRAELAAQGVRVTAVEEELAAIRARLSNVKVSGDFRIRYNFFPTGSPSTTTGVPTINVRDRLTFRASASPLTIVTRVITGAPCALTGTPPPTTCGTGTGSISFATPGTFGPIGFDLAYLDAANVLGADWRAGQWDYTLSPFGINDYGLLLDFSDVGPAGVGDGFAVTTAFGGLKFHASAWRDTTAQDIFAGRVEAALIPGWTASLSGITQRRNHTFAAPLTSTSDTGWALDAKGNIIPGVGLQVAYASFTGATGAATSLSSNSYAAYVTFDLGQLAGVTTFAPRVAVWYKNYGNSTTPVPVPLYSGATTEFFEAFGWNFRGWGTKVDLAFTPTVSGQLWYESGNCNFVVVPSGGPTATNPGCATAGNSVVEWFAQVSYTGLAPRTTLSFNYRRQTVAGTDTANQYRIQVFYTVP